MGNIWMALDNKHGSPGEIQGIIYNLQKRFKQFSLSCISARSGAGQWRRTKKPKSSKDRIMFLFWIMIQSLYPFSPQKNIITGHGKNSDYFLFTKWTTASKVHIYLSNSSFRDYYSLKLLFLSLEVCMGKY